ncbi:MAG: dihydropteroate synthase [Muribaculum sp.]|nr:dihydropteroate synthase [Muribaculum sp.]
MRTLNIRGRLYELDTPKIMGILNATPDSFYDGCRAQDNAAIAARVRQIRDEGADIIDIGACSTRPGSKPVDALSELQRLESAIEITRREWRDAIISIDTFRANVGRKCIEAGADIVNDISGGSDPDMFDTIAALHVPYILTHNHPSEQLPNPELTTGNCERSTASVITELAFRIRELRQRGVCDIIVDPGFGFAKTTEQNYQLMTDLEEFVKIGLPLLVGVSRKSMIWRPLGITPADALPGTIALNTVALLKGADILRVHDVAAAKQALTVTMPFLPTPQSIADY